MSAVFSAEVPYFSHDTECKNQVHVQPFFIFKKCLKNSYNKNIYRQQQQE